MEKTFAHATLFSATVITAYMLFSPPAHLSAQNDVRIDENIRVRKAVVQDVDFKDNVVVIELEDAKGLGIPVLIGSTTTVTLGNGNETQLPALREGMPIYVFGNYDPESRTIAAEKIVIRNKRITERTTLSRAEIERSKRDRFTRKNETAQSSTFGSIGLLRVD